MASGLPDWSQVKTTLEYNFSSDSGELAARLGSPFRYYRSGNVVFFTSFETGDDYMEYFPTGAAGIVAPTTAQALTGEKSLEMAADSAGTVCQADKYLPYYAGGKVAISCAIDRALLTNHFLFRYQYAKEGVVRQALLIYNFGTKKFGVLDDTVTYNYMPRAYTESFPGQPTWFTIKMYIDTDLHKYYALNLNNDLYDISTINLYETTTIYQDNSYISLILNLPAAGVSRCYIDNLIYTVNDPN